MWWCIALEGLKKILHGDDELLKAFDAQALDVEVGVSLEEVTVLCGSADRVSVHRHSLVNVFKQPTVLSAIVAL